MTDFEKDEALEFDDGEDIIVEITDEDGEVSYYREELIIPVGEDKFALLVGIADDDDEPVDPEEEDVIIAKIVKGDDGEEEYVDPTDEEFDAVQAAYNALMDEEEQNQND